MSEDLLAHIAVYLRSRRRIAAIHSTSFDEIREFLTVNTQELLGVPAPELEHWRPVVDDAHPCKVDGRMLPHEWLATSQGYLKSDAVDHHADHFFPGCVDIAWDVAATCVEWGLDSSGRAFLIRELRDSGLPRRLPFYDAAYLAFRGAYASMAAASMGECADARRFRILEREYAGRLAQRLIELDCL